MAACPLDLGAAEACGRCDECVPRDGGCDAELSLFTSAEMLAADERDAWGVITLPKCRER